MTRATVTRTTRVSISALKAENTKLRAQLAELTETVKLHEECLTITADVLKRLQNESKAKTAAPAAKKQTPKTSGSIGRPWEKLNKDEKHRLNAYAQRHLNEVGGSWEAWSELRLTLMFR